ncbi:MAG TPA: N,N-dimethylformamidase beta subunit family domain-containing protein [Streptosporangiaceae bacterium]|jgi:N,N-dimethylformamidase
MTEPAQATGLRLAKRIIGYCDPLSAAPGEQVSFYVSCAPGIGQYQAELVRLRAGPPGWEATGPVCEPAGCAGSYPGRAQQARPGSYAVIPGADGLLAGDVTIAVLVQPTYQAGACQVLLSVADPWAGDGQGLALILDEQLRPALVTGPGPAARLTCPVPLALGTWTVLAATLRENAPARLSAGGLQRASAQPPGAGQPPGPGRPPATEQPPGAGWASVAGAAPGLGPAAGTDLVLAAVRSPAGRTRLHFTGRLEFPVVLDGAVSPDQAGALLAAGPGALAPGQARAAWDFAAGIGGWTITGLGPRARPGTLHNLPMRAVRGASWTGEHTDWKQAPGQYAAIHFLADALEDCQWDADFTWTIPAGTRSGYYAARITAGQHRDFIPVFVRPAGPPAPVLLIAPTATYAAYGNSRFWWERPVQEMVQDALIDLGAEEQYLITAPELGASSYDNHLDGTDVCYVSRRRPNLNMRPGHVRREGYTSDLDLVAWLDQQGVSYDVVTDEDLHAAGAGLLAPYRVVLTGTHPEYMSAIEFDAISDWTAGGGRLMYLGGNGFAMNVTFSPERPWIMENRRVELWERGEEVQRSEAFHAADGMRGGHLSASGRQAAAVTGVESATMGFDHSYPYRLGPAARRPEAAFVFAGVSGEVIGDFGAIGGGVVGQEWDNAAGHDLGPGHLILGSSHDHTFVPPMIGAIRPDYHADLVLYFRGAGAAFSVSSMAWCAALSHDGYANEVARITGNVLRRFLDPAPLRPVPPDGRS